MLEKLAASNPSDNVLFARLGLSLLKTSGMLPDAEMRRQQRVRARAAFAKAVQLGSKDNQIIALLNGIPADGGPDASFSGNAAVEDVMRKAEVAYSSGDYRLAFTNYQQALALDPMLYTAALFSGDASAQLLLVDSAYVWYERATKIDPDKETAWRYWSDVLLKHDKLDEARDKAVSAMIAEPYNRFSLQAISAWAPKARVSVGYPRVDLAPAINGAPDSRAWSAYDSVRRVWKGTSREGGAMFTAGYPAEDQYRHSVGEELAALQAAYRAEPENNSMVRLKALDDAGLLTAYVLFARPDAGIALEYPSYRQAHREELRKFWFDAVLGGLYSK